MDKHTPEQRHRNMQAVKNKGSKIVADIAIEAVKAIPVAGSVLGTAAEGVIDAILESRNKA